MRAIMRCFKLPILDRLAMTAGLVVAGALILGVLLRWYQQHSGLVTSDPYTYVMFAQSLARGEFFLTTRTAEAVAAMGATELTPVGPVWNTSILPDGRMVFTVGISYPLWLALMLRIGGLSLCLHANYLLLGLVLLVFGLLVWESAGRSSRAAATAMLALLLFFLTSAPTLRQFTHLWREPLTYLCLLASCYSIVRFGRSGRAVWAAVAAFMMGYAVGVKEANAMYIPVLALIAFLLPRFRHYPFKVRLILLAVVMLGVGLLPILIQNSVATGNPLLSLQSIRETREFSITDAGAGLSAGNTGETIRRYLNLYAGLMLFRWPFWLLALLGAVQSWRHPVGGMMLGILVTHLALYLQWGSAEFRHILLAHIPYCFFLAHGMAALCAIPARLWHATRRAHLAACLAWFLVLVLSALTVRSLRPLRGRANTQSYRQFSEFSNAIAAPIPRGSVLLVNRFAREIIATYTGVESIILPEWSHIIGDDDPLSVVRWQLAREVRVFFLDSVDRSPRNVGRVNWQSQQQALLSSSYDLHPVLTLSAAEFGMQQILGQEDVTLYEVLPWTATRSEAILGVPEGGAAFLECPARSLQDRMQVTLGNTHLPWNGTRFWPVPPGGTNDRQRLTVTAHGEAVPSQLGARLVNWREPIPVNIGADAFPADTGFFPDGLGPQALHQRRQFDRPVRIRVPVREGEDCFTALRFQMVPVLTQPEASSQVEIQVPGQPTHGISLARRHPTSVLVPMRNLKPENVARWSGVRDVVIHPLAEGAVAIDWFRSAIAWTHLMLEPSTETLLFGISASVVPDLGSDERMTMSIRFTGVEHQDMSLAFDATHWTNEVRSVRFFVERSQWSDEPVSLQVEGGGLADVEWAALPRTLTLRPNAVERFFMKGFFNPEGPGTEAFAWSTGSASVRVPLSESATSYRMTLDVVDGHPVQQGRELVVAFEGQVRALTLPRNRETLTVDWAVPENRAPRAGEVTFSIPEWSPASVEKTTDQRLLGFRLYGLTWTPMQEE